MVYRESSRTASAIQRNPVSKNKNKQTTKKIRTKQKQNLIFVRVEMCGARKQYE